MVAQRRTRWAALLAVLVLGALTGCSALSGRDESQHGRHTTPAAPPSPPPPGAQFGAAAVGPLLAAARTDFETVYTFDYRNLPKYLAAGLAVSTGSYAKTYRGLLTGKAATQLRAAREVQAPAVDLVGLADLSDRGLRARVIAHATLTTSTAAASNPVTSTTTDVLQLTSVHGRWLIAAITRGSAALGSIPANPPLSAAMAAARGGIVLIFGIRRAHFAGDFAAALARTTGALHDSLVAQQSTLQGKLNTGQYDLTATVTGFAAVRAAGDTSEFLVSIDEYRVSPQGARLGPYPLSFDLTATNSAGHWLLSQSTSVT